MSRNICTADGCERFVHGRGMCDLHYQRWKAETPSSERLAPSPIDRFTSKFDMTPGCWIWQGHLSLDGYGLFRHGSKVHRAHRYSYEVFVGPIPDGLVIDHLCRNRACIRPEHLEPVTLVENVMRGVGTGAIYARRTHCKHGHELTPANIYPSRLPTRVCVTCARNNATKAAAKKRSQKVSQSK